MVIQLLLAIALVVGPFFYVMMAKESDRNLKTWQALAVLSGLGFLAYASGTKKPYDQMSFNERMNNRFGPFYKIFFWIIFLTTFGLYDLSSLANNFGLGGIFETKPGEMISKKLMNLVLGISVIIPTIYLVVCMFSTTRQVKISYFFIPVTIVASILLLQNIGGMKEFFGTSDFRPAQSAYAATQPTYVAPQPAPQVARPSVQTGNNANFPGLNCGAGSNEGVCVISVGTRYLAKNKEMGDLATFQNCVRVPQNPNPRYSKDTAYECISRNARVVWFVHEPSGRLIQSITR